VIIISGTFEFDPDQRDAYITSRHEGMRTSRAEPGCLEYTFSADPLDAGRVLLFERWTDQAALDAHIAGMRSAPRPPADAPRPPKPTSSSILLYDVTGERPLG
jgi:quinol monooxygenase YgiN